MEDPSAPKQQPYLARTARMHLLGSDDASVPLSPVVQSVQMQPLYCQPTTTYADGQPALLGKYMSHGMGVLHTSQFGSEKASEVVGPRLV